MTLKFPEDPCEAIDSSYEDNNVFKRSVLRILCKLVPGVTPLLGKFGLLDSTGADITTANPLPVTGTVVVTSLPPIVIPAPVGGATAANQVLGNNSLSSIVSNQATAANQVVANALINNISNSVESSFAFAMEEGATYTYLGWAAPGSAEAAAVWRIARLTNADNRKVWADGNKNFDNDWSNHGALVYM